MASSHRSRLVYILGPHVEGDPFISLRMAVQNAEVLRNAGYTPHVPQLHMLWHMVSPREQDDFISINMDFLKMCGAVVKIPGVVNSDSPEEQLANELGIPVYESVFDYIKACKTPTLSVVASTGV